MRNALHDLWGCGVGPIARLAPRSRILAGLLAFGSCMAAPASTATGAALIGAVVLAWMLGCRPPWHVVRGTALVGMALLLPYVLVMPVMRGGTDPRPWWSAWPVVASVLNHGMAGILVSVSAATTLTQADLREGIARLPVPRLVSAILLQIVHQTATLGYETRRVAAAMSVRGASGSGLAAWRVLSSLPQVWLPRVILRAERVASAMEVRGYCEQDLPAFPRVSKHAFDTIVLASLLAVVALALWLRFGGVA